MDILGLGFELFFFGWVIVVFKRVRVLVEYILDLFFRGFFVFLEVGIIYRFFKFFFYIEIFYLVEEVKMEERWGLGGGFVRDNREDDKGFLGLLGVVGE